MIHRRTLYVNEIPPRNSSSIRVRIAPSVHRIVLVFPFGYEAIALLVHRPMLPKTRQRFPQGLYPSVECRDDLTQQFAEKTHR